MLNNFNKDLANAKEAEEIVLKTFSANTTKYNFFDVSTDRDYFYKGDIKAVEKETGREIYIEVKDDSRIAETGKVLCEEEVFYKDACYCGKGNMKSNYDIYCVVSKQDRKIYVIDFDGLKRIYRKFGEYKEINHSQQITYCYLLELCRVKQFGALITTVKY